MCIAYDSCNVHDVNSFVGHLSWHIEMYSPYAKNVYCIYIYIIIYIYLEIQRTFDSGRSSSHLASTANVSFVAFSPDVQVVWGGNA